MRGDTERAFPLFSRPIARRLSKYARRRSRIGFALFGFVGARGDVSKSDDETVSRSPPAVSDIRRGVLRRSRSRPYLAARLRMSASDVPFLLRGGDTDAGRRVAPLVLSRRPRFAPSFSPTVASSSSSSAPRWAWGSVTAHVTTYFRFVISMQFENLCPEPFRGAPAAAPEANDAVATARRLFGKRQAVTLGVSLETRSDLDPDRHRRCDGNVGSSLPAVTGVSHPTSAFAGDACTVHVIAATCAEHLSEKCPFINIQKDVMNRGVLAGFN